MEDLAKFDRLNARFLELAAIEGKTLAIKQRDRAGERLLGLVPYFEVVKDRWLTIGHEPEPGISDAQLSYLSDGIAKMDLFADVETGVDLLWQMRCAWFDFDVGPEQAAARVWDIAGIPYTQ